MESYFVRRGWQVCARRWRTPWAEVDRVFCKGRRLVLVEVKSLSSLDHVATAVSERQKLRLSRVMENLIEGVSDYRVEMVLAVVLPGQKLHWFTDFLAE